MRKGITLLVCGLMLSGAGLQAHDEGHGPKLTDVGQQGGIVNPVIDKKEEKKGAKASVVYKAELVRFEDGSVAVYLYDEEMAALDLSGFEAEAKGMLETHRRGKTSKEPFSLTLEDGAFTGQAPKPPFRPFNIDVTFTKGKNEYLVAFDNLD